MKKTLVYALLIFSISNNSILGQAAPRMDSLNYYFEAGLVFDGGLSDIIAISPLWGLELEHPRTNLGLRFQRSYIFFLPRQSNGSNANSTSRSLSDYDFYYDTDLVITYLLKRHTNANGKKRRSLILSVGHSWSGQDGSTSIFVDKLLRTSIGIPVSKFYLELAASFYYETDFELYPSARTYYRFKI